MRVQQFSLGEITAPKQEVRGGLLRRTNNQQELIAVRWRAAEFSAAHWLTLQSPIAVQ
jgi:hypothetical protein